MAVFVKKFYLSQLYFKYPRGTRHLLGEAIVYLLSTYILFGNVNNHPLI